LVPWSEPIRAWNAPAVTGNAALAVSPPTSTRWRGPSKTTLVAPVRAADSRERTAAERSLERSRESFATKVCDLASSLTESSIAAPGGKSFDVVAPAM
jgi:hypothetical protein